MEQDINIGILLILPTGPERGLFPISHGQCGILCSVKNTCDAFLILVYWGPIIWQRSSAGQSSGIIILPPVL